MNNPLALLAAHRGADDVPLLTFDEVAALPSHQIADNLADPLVPFRFVSAPDAEGKVWTWYPISAEWVVERDRRDLTAIIVYGAERLVDLQFFGLVDGIEQELGTFSLRELTDRSTETAALLGPALWGPVHRDQEWTARPLSAVKTDIGYQWR